MQNIAETSGGMVCFLGIGFLFLMLFALSRMGSSGASVGKSPLVKRHETEQEHDTFTNEEILTFGVDVRSKHARNQIEMSRWAKSRGLLPSQQRAKFDAEYRDRRKLFAEDPEIVEGEIVEEKWRPLPRSERSKRLLGG